MPNRSPPSISAALDGLGKACLILPVISRISRGEGLTKKYRKAAMLAMWNIHARESSGLEKDRKRLRPRSTRTTGTAMLNLGNTALPGDIPWPLDSREEGKKTVGLLMYAAARASPPARNRYSPNPRASSCSRKCWPARANAKARRAKKPLITIMFTSIKLSRPASDAPGFCIRGITPSANCLLSPQ